MCRCTDSGVISELSLVFSIFRPWSKGMRVYFMGICGTAMGNAALLLREQGHEVFGADTGVYPPMSDVLRNADITVLEGFDAERLENLRVDRIVIGNAMSRGNVEVEWALDQSDIPFVSLPQLFHETVLPDRKSIVITGTHGKTTTSTLTAFLLEKSGENPGWLIGGVPYDLPGGAHLGEGKPFVVEGDEYDSAFFDKRSKFIHYRPQIAVLNNLEFDHADIFRDLIDVQRTFRHFLKIIPASGYALVNGDDTNVVELLPAPWTQVIRVGTGADNDLVLSEFVDSERGSCFKLIWRGYYWTTVSWQLHGLFNARNAAMAALAAAFACGFEDPCGFCLDTLKDFRGVKRRQDLLFVSPKLTILEDFAHHPTAVKGALEALRAAFPSHHICACFEPRSNTAASSLFQRAFTDALSLADSIYIGAVHRADRMEASERLDTEKIACELTSISGKTASAFDTNDALLASLFLKMNEHGVGPHLIVFFSNGSFDQIPQKLVAAQSSS